MANAAALLAGLALIWFCWAPQPLDQYWLISGAFGVSGAFLVALLMRAADRESAPYARAPLSLARALADSRRIVSASIDTARRASAGEPLLNPALVRFKTGPGDEATRIAFAHAAARAPGAVVVDIEEDALLVHVLVENDANEAALRALDRRDAS
jgi:multisubunit Na+/H+ antiporter MnhE subunit